MPSQHREVPHTLILESAVGLYVGLTGAFRTLIQKSTGMVPPFKKKIS